MSNNYELSRLEYFLVQQLEKLMNEFSESNGSDDFTEGRIHQLKNTILRLQNIDYTSSDHEIVESTP